MSENGAVGSFQISVSDDLRRSLDITFEVGERERHIVRFFYNQFWGNGRIRVDGVVIRRFIVILSLSTSRWYRFVVGSGERHEVEIEKVRKRFFGDSMSSTFASSSTVSSDLHTEVSEALHEPDALPVAIAGQVCVAEIDTRQIGPGEIDAGAVGEVGRGGVRHDGAAVDDCVG